MMQNSARSAALPVRSAMAAVAPSPTRPCRPRAGVLPFPLRIRTADETRIAIEAGSRLPFQLWLALGVLAGAALVAGRQLRIPDRPRIARAVAGGLLIGVGASIAHGCNIGHGLTGLPLVSLGSALATAGMAGGALVTWRALLATRPALRGTERVAHRTSSACHTGRRLGLESQWRR
jgi:hypothetical protein